MRGPKSLRELPESAWQRKHSREFRLDSLFQLLDGGSAVLAIEAAGVVHEDDVGEARIAQDGLQL